MLERIPFSYTDIVLFPSFLIRPAAVFPRRPNHNMPAVLNNDIFSLIISHLASSYSFYLSYALFKTDNDREDLLRELGYSTAPWIAGKEAKNALLALRSTCSFLAIIVAPILFPQIYVRNMDEKSARRLKGIRKSKLIPSAVKTLCFLERLPGKSPRPACYHEYILLVVEDLC